MMTKMDTVIQQLQREDFVAVNDLRALQLTDTLSLYYMDGARDSALCTKTVRLNENIFYSIVAIGDTVGVCSHMMIITVNQKERKAVADRYLYAGCDVDYSTGGYHVYNHEVAATNTVSVFRETYEKIAGAAADPDDRDPPVRLERADTAYYTISSAGQISVRGFIPSDN